MVMDAKTAILARAREAIERSQEGRPVRKRDVPSEKFLVTTSAKANIPPVRMKSLLR